MTGAGTWVVNGLGAVISVNTALANVTGDVQVLNGTMELNTDFDTTGNLTFQSVAGSMPTLMLATGVLADFGQ